MNWEISLTIISLSFLALTLMVVLLFMQIIKTAKNIETALQTLNSRLPDILSDVHEIIRNINYMSIALRGKIENVTLALEKINELSRFIDVLKPSIETPLLKAVGRLNAVKKGVEIFLSTLKAKSA